jgi:hypothetical protein
VRRPHEHVSILKDLARGLEHTLLRDVLHCRGEEQDMRRLVVRSFVMLTAVVFGLTACNSTTSNTPTTPTTPTTPSTPSVTDTFNGTLTPNGAASYSFTAQGSGTVTATLTSLGPDSAITVGFGIGTWNGTACATSPGIWNDNAAQSAVVIGSVSAASVLCVRVADVSAKVTTPLPYTLTVVHP